MSPFSSFIYTYVVVQLKEIFENGPNAESLDKARKLIQSKTEELQNALEPAAKEAWDKAVEQAKPYLDKLPTDLRGTLTSSATAAAFSSNASELFDRVRKATEAKGGERDKLIKDLQNYVSEGADKAKGAVGVKWDDLLGYIKSVGGEDVLKKIPNAEALTELTEKHGEEAGKLAKETWDEVLEVLKKKSDRAKEIVKDAKEDTKRKASK